MIVFGETRLNKAITEDLVQDIKSLDDAELVDVFACISAHIADGEEKNPDAIVFLNKARELNDAVYSEIKDRFTSLEEVYSIFKIKNIFDLLALGRALKK